MNRAVAAHGLLVSDEVFADFTVTFEYRVHEGDSGFYFRVDEIDGSVGVHGFQVEVDDVQTNLTRFSLFFPEKRPFFLENAGNFSVGGGGAELFFSRRIGISEDGDPIPIDGGARVTGKIGRTNVGVLGMYTEEVVGEESLFASDGFGVLRVNRELANRSPGGGTPPAGGRVLPRSARVIGAVPRFLPTSA